MTEPELTYLATPIVETLTREPRPYAGMTRDGYTKRAGAPTSHMVRLRGETRWRRLMCWQFSNAGTLFVRIGGVPHIVRDLPNECSICRRRHDRSITHASE